MADGKWTEEQRAAYEAGYQKGIAESIGKLSLKAGDLVVTRSVTWSQAAYLRNVLRDTKVETGPHYVVSLVPPDLELQAADERTMEAAGWIRKPDHG